MEERKNNKNSRGMQSIQVLLVRFLPSAVSDLVESTAAAVNANKIYLYFLQTFICIYIFELRFTQLRECVGKCTFVLKPIGKSNTNTELLGNWL